MDQWNNNCYQTYIKTMMNNWQSCINYVENVSEHFEGTPIIFIELIKLLKSKHTGQMTFSIMLNFHENRLTYDQWKQRKVQKSQTDGETSLLVVNSNSFGEISMVFNEYVSALLSGYTTSKFCILYVIIIFNVKP